MEKKEIRDGNVLIAEFMGKSYTADSIMVPQVPSIAELRYDYSWNWLMEVVEKIRSLEEGMLIERIDIMPNDGIAIYLTNKEDIIIDVDTDISSTIKATYLGVIQFIKWYNQNCKQDEESNL